MYDSQSQHLIQSLLNNFKERLSKKQDAGVPLYLIASAPKSGSTYAARVLSNYLGTAPFFAGKIPDRASQDLSSIWIEEQRPRGNQVIHQHVCYHQATKCYLDHYKITPLVLVRNIYDTVMSIKDHLKQEGNGNWPGVYIDKEMISRADDEQLEMICSLIVPWYLTFFSGWIQTGVPVISYNDVINRPEVILSSLDIPIDHDKLSGVLENINPSSIRLNQGKIGRGAFLSQKCRDKVDEILFFYRHLPLEILVS